MICKAVFLFLLLSVYETKGQVFRPTQALPGEFEYVVKVLCGGSIFTGTIISRNWVLTVAHGLFDRRRRNEATGEAARLCDEAYVERLWSSLFYEHYNYRRNNLYDVALIKVENVHLGREIKPLPRLAHPPQHLINHRCRAVGWADIINDAYPSWQRANQYDDANCDQLARDMGRNFDSAINLCASGQVHRGIVQLTTGGDSGGPFVCRIGNRWEVMGVAMEGGPYLLSYFVKTSSILQWVEGTMRWYR